MRTRTQAAGINELDATRRSSAASRFAGRLKELGEEQKP